jgi:general stress protein YciG
MATSDRGFASMSKKKVKEIAKKGGESSHRSSDSSSG